MSYEKWLKLRLLIIKLKLSWNYIKNINACINSINKAVGGYTTLRITHPFANLYRHMNPAHHQCMYFLPIRQMRHSCAMIRCDVPEIRRIFSLNSNTEKNRRENMPLSLTQCQLLPWRYSGSMSMFHASSSSFPRHRFIYYKIAARAERRCVHAPPTGARTINRSLLSI